MSAPIEPHEAALIDGVLQAIRADTQVRDFFGEPPRIFDDESRRPIYPYAELVSAETRDVASVLTPGGEHRLTFAVYVAHGGRAAAAEGLDVLQRAVQAADITLPNASIILAHPVYLDVMRAKRSDTFRCLLRLRIVTETESIND